MLCGLLPRLTLQLMRLGLSLHEAERLTGFVMTWIVIVVTLMGYTLCPSCNGSGAGSGKRILKDTSGIRYCTGGSQYCGSGNQDADARLSYPALLAI